VEALECLLNLQPSLENSEEFCSERRRHQYTNDLRRCERLADADRHQDAMDGLDLTYELVDLAEEFGDVVNLRKLRLHLLEQLVKCSHWEGRPDETRWYVERTAQECTDLLDLIPRKEKGERASLLERRARVVLDYDVLPREPKATFQDFGKIIKDINDAVKLAPKDPSLYHLRGWLYQNIEGDKMEKALLDNSEKDLRKACALVKQEKKASKEKGSNTWNVREPTQDLRDTLHLLGKCLFRQKKHREAAASLEEALRMPWQSLQRKDSEQLKEEIEKMAETVKAALQEEADKAERELESLLGMEEESASKKAIKSDKKKKQKAKKAAAAAAAADGTGPTPAVKVESGAQDAKSKAGVASPGRYVTVGEDGSVVEVLQQADVSAKTGAGGAGGGLNKNQKKKQRKKKSKAAAAVREQSGTPDGSGNGQSSDADAGTSSNLDPGQAQLKRLLDSNGLAKHAQQFCAERRMTVEMLKQYGKSDLEGMGLSEKDASVLMEALWKAPDPVDPAKMVEDYCRMVVMDGTHGGELELAALAQLLNRKIYVYQEEVKANENQSEDKVMLCTPTSILSNLGPFDAWIV
jgi:tetratricopeptide (TPR) repeat protein